MGMWFYEIKVKCENCGLPNKLRVRKGTDVGEFIKGKDCKCKNCGCKIEPEEYSTEWLK
jgi:hypothetical protein